jgi:hypothetical protein
MKGIDHAPEVRSHGPSVANSEKDEGSFGSESDTDHRPNRRLLFHRQQT